MSELLRVGVPPKIADGLIGLDAHRPAVVAAVHCLRDPKKTIFVISGGVGTGKTTAACYALSLSRDATEVSKFYQRQGETAPPCGYDTGERETLSGVVYEIWATNRGEGPLNGRFYLASELCSREPWDNTFWNDEVLRPPFLVVDDLGSEPALNRDLMRQKLADLLVKRDSRRHKTVVTT